jgi:hypothetical protein
MLHLHRADFQIQATRTRFAGGDPGGNTHSINGYHLSYRIIGQNRPHDSGISIRRITRICCFGTRAEKQVRWAAVALATEPGGESAELGGVESKKTIRTASER